MLLNSLAHLVFCGTGAIVIDQQTKGAVTHVGIAITFGLIVMAMIYALGNISGAHIPARTNVARPSRARQCGILIFIDQYENQNKKQ